MLKTDIKQTDNKINSIYNKRVRSDNVNEKKDMKTCIRPCVLMINECDKRYIIFKIFFTLIQGLLPATFIIIMQKIINLIQKKADVREILLYTCMDLVLLLLENINGNIE